MPKKIASLLLSLLICVSLMSGQAHVAALTVPNETPDQVELLNTGTPDESEDPIMPLDYPETADSGQPGT